MKKIATLLFCALLLSCSKEESAAEHNEIQMDGQEGLLSVESINAAIRKSIEDTGDVEWSKLPVDVIWSAAVRGNNMLTVGYGTEGQSFSGRKSAEFTAAKRQLIAGVQQLESTEKEIVLSDDTTLSVLEIAITNRASVEKLLATDNVRYIEPNGYNQFRMNTAAQKKSKCDADVPTLSSRDYTNISPNAKLPWNFKIHNIDKAWQLSTGAGITVGLIDTGISPNQNKLGSQFNDGSSTGRSISKFGTFIDSFWWWSNNVDGPNDDSPCSHGTQMAAALAGPRNDDGMPVGVAYNSNLVSYRGVEDVIIDDYHEKKGVSNALKALANRRDVKVISMSLGAVFSIGNVRDAIRYAHSKGKLIIAAGGTSSSITNFVGVIFPANMNETVAVTGIIENKGYQRCDNCHSGSKIDFTIVMEREAGGNTVPVLGVNNGESKYIGGSSVATAMTAGIAALVWSKHPEWNRSQVLEQLKKSSDLYPNRSRSYGYGNIDALKAVQ